MACLNHSTSEEFLRLRSGPPSEVTYRFFVIVFFFTIYYLIFNIHTVYAADFSQLQLRLDRIKIGSPIAGTLCAKPSAGNAGTEGKVSITFPSDFSISGSSSNWTTSTTNLQSNSTAWPGIGGTASNISGTTVTFASGDLTSPTTLYCFNFQSTSSQTGSAGQKSGTVETKSSSDSPIDTKGYAVSIVSDDQIRVTAKVGATSSDMQVNLVALNTQPEVSQDTFIDYEVTYGSNLPDPANLTLEVEGKPGIIEGSSAPSVDIVDYVYGSATLGHNGIAPVIDVVNRKVRWTFDAFPGNTTDKKVRFSLRTNNFYTGSSRVNFSVVARIIGPSFVTPDRVVTKSYKYDPNKVTTSTSTSTSTSTQTTTSTTTTATTAIPYQPPPYPGYVPPSVFQNIFVPIISQEDAKIFIQTYQKYFPSVRYGSTPFRMTDKVTSLNKTNKQTLEVTDLRPDTNYYFKAEVKDESGKVIGSETFTFKTAEVSDKPQVEKSSLIITSQSSIISTQAQTISEDGQISQRDQKPSIVVPKQTIYEIRFALKRGQTAKKVQAIVRNRTVLGATTAYAEEPGSEVVDMVEVEAGIYAGSLKSKPQAGYYEQFIRIEDTKGNVQEEKIADIKVLNPFTVRSAQSKEVIEGARVLISLYNPKTKLYKVIPPNVIPIGNPSFTDNKGEVDLVLGQGKYKAEIMTLGQKDQTKEFTIGPNPDDGFPIVHLEQAPFNPLNFVLYLWRSFTEVFLKQLLLGAQDLKVLAESVRIFDLFATGSILVLIFLSMLTFYLRTHMHLFSITRFFLFHTNHLLPKGISASFFTGRVLDDEKRAVSKATVFLVDEKEHRVVDETQTNKLGEFYLKATAHPVIKIIVMKKGYEPEELVEHPQEKGSKEKITVELKKSESFELTLRKKLLYGAESIFGWSFELILLITVIFEILFLQTLGPLKTAPFILVSLANFFLWLLYLKQLLHHKTTL